MDILDDIRGSFDRFTIEDMTSRGGEAGTEYGNNITSSILSIIEEDLDRVPPVRSNVVVDSKGSIPNGREAELLESRVSLGYEGSRCESVRNVASIALEGFSSGLTVTKERSARFDERCGLQLECGLDSSEVFCGGKEFGFAQPGASSVLGGFNDDVSSVGSAWDGLAVGSGRPKEKPALKDVSGVKFDLVPFFDEKDSSPWDYDTLGALESFPSGEKSIASQYGVSSGYVGSNDEAAEQSSSVVLQEIDLVVSRRKEKSESRNLRRVEPKLAPFFGMQDFSQGVDNSGFSGFSSDREPGLLKDKISSDYIGPSDAAIGGVTSALLIDLSEEPETKSLREIDPNLIPTLDLKDFTQENSNKCLSLFAPFYKALFMEWEPSHGRLILNNELFTDYMVTVFLSMVRFIVKRMEVNNAFNSTKSFNIKKFSTSGDTSHLDKFFSFLKKLLDLSLSSLEDEKLIYGIKDRFVKELPSRFLSGTPRYEDECLYWNPGNASMLEIEEFLSSKFFASCEFSQLLFFHKFANDIYYAPRSDSPIHIFAKFLFFIINGHGCQLTLESGCFINLPTPYLSLGYVDLLAKAVFFLVFVSQSFFQAGKPIKLGHWHCTSRLLKELNSDCTILSAFTQSILGFLGNHLVSINVSVMYAYILVSTVYRNFHRILHLASVVVDHDVKSDIFYYHDKTIVNSLINVHSYVGGLVFDCYWMDFLSHFAEIFISALNSSSSVNQDARDVFIDVVRCYVSNALSMHKIVMNESILHATLLVAGRFFDKRLENWFNLKKIRGHPSYCLSRAEVGKMFRGLTPFFANHMVGVIDYIISNHSNLSGNVMSKEIVDSIYRTCLHKMLSVGVEGSLFVESALVSIYSWMDTPKVSDKMALSELKELFSQWKDSAIYHQKIRSEEFSSVLSLLLKFYLFRFGVVELLFADMKDLHSLSVGGVIRNISSVEIYKNISLLSDAFLSPFCKFLDGNIEKIKKDALSICMKDLASMSLLSHPEKSRLSDDDLDLTSLYLSVVQVNKYKKYSSAAFDELISGIKDIDTLEYKWLVSMSKTIATSVSFSSGVKHFYLCLNKFLGMHSVTVDQLDNIIYVNNFSFREKSMKELFSIFSRLSLSTKDVLALFFKVFARFYDKIGEFNHLFDQFNLEYSAYFTNNHILPKESIVTLFMAMNRSLSKVVEKCDQSILNKEIEIRSSLLSNKSFFKEMALLFKSSVLELLSVTSDEGDGISVLSEIINSKSLTNDQVRIFFSLSLTLFHHLSLVYTTFASISNFASFTVDILIELVKSHEHGVSGFQEVVDGMDDLVVFLLPIFERTDTSMNMVDRIYLSTFADVVRITSGWPFHHKAKLLLSLLGPRDMDAEDLFISIECVKKCLYLLLIESDISSVSADSLVDFVLAIHPNFSKDSLSEVSRMVLRQVSLSVVRSKFL